MSTQLSPTILRSLALVAILAGTRHALAQSIVGTGVPAGAQSFSPVGLSADGQTVLGNDSSGRAFLWTASGGFQPLGVPAGWALTLASALSADGTIVAGRLFRNAASNYHAFRWSAAGGFQDLGLIPGGNFTYGYALSADGSVVVGQGNNGTNRYSAIRWSAATGLTQLPHMPGSISDAVAWATSGDGAIVVGQEYVGGPSSGYRGFRWSAATGAQGLSILSGFRSAHAYAITPDGSVIAGTCSASPFDPPSFPVTWDSAGNITNLGLPAGMTEAQPSCISADGSAIGLLSRLDGGPVAGLWTAAIGTVNLNTYLPTIGVDLSHWFLTRTYAISADGSVIAGEGGYYDDQGIAHSQTWIVGLPCTIPPAITADPAPATVCPTGTATFTVGASGVAITSYRWQWRTDSAPDEWTDLLESGNPPDTDPIFSATGTSTPALQITPLPAFADAAPAFRCVVSNACGDTPSAPASLTVTAADFNCDGARNADDLADFITGYFNSPSDPRTDFNGDGVINADDLGDFITAYFNG